MSSTIAQIVQGTGRGARVLANVANAAVQLRRSGIQMPGVGRQYLMGGSPRSGQQSRTTSVLGKVKLTLELNLVGGSARGLRRNFGILQRALETARMREESEQVGDTVYLRYCINDAMDGVEPVIGWSMKYLQIYGGRLSYPSENLGPEVVSGTMLGVTLEADFASEAIAPLQPAWSATGFLRECDDGLMFSSGSQNFVSNPSFEHSTYTTAWTFTSTGNNHRTTRETNYVVTGQAAIRITAGADDVTVTQLQQPYTGTCSLSFMVRLPDGGVPTTKQICGFHNATGNLATTFTRVPWLDEWYWCHSLFVCGALSATGVKVKAGYEVIVDDVQINASILHEPFAMGSMPGCSWAATAHGTASATTVSPTIIKMDATDDGFVDLPHQFTVVAWARATSLDDQTGNLWYYQVSNGATETEHVGVRWDGGSPSQWVMRYGTVVCNMAYGTLTPVTPYMTAMTYVNGLASFYINGTLLGSTAAPLVHPQAQPYWALGYNGYSDVLDSWSGIIDGFRVYDQAASAAQIAAMYSAELQLKTAGYAVQRLPVVWTRYGSRTTENVIDGTYDNFAIVAGVDGDGPADVNWIIRAGDAGYTGCNVYLWRKAQPWDDYTHGSAWIHDMGGSALTGAWGGSVQNVSAATGTNIGTLNAHPRRDMLRGDNVYLLRLKNNSGTAIAVAPAYSIGTNGANIASPDTVSIPSGTAQVLRNAGNIMVAWDDVSAASNPYITTSAVDLHLTCTVSGTANIQADALLICPRPFAMIAGGPSGAYRYNLHGHNCSVYSTGGTLYGQVEQRGDSVTLEPWNLNVVYCMHSGTAHEHVTSAVTGWRMVGVIPKFSAFGL